MAAKPWQKRGGLFGRSCLTVMILVNKPFTCQHLFPLCQSSGMYWTFSAVLNLPDGGVWSGCFFFKIFQWITVEGLPPEEINVFILCDNRSSREINILRSALGHYFFFAMMSVLKDLHHIKSISSLHLTEGPEKSMCKTFHSDSTALLHRLTSKECCLHCIQLCTSGHKHTWPLGALLGPGLSFHCNPHSINQTTVF